MDRGIDGAGLGEASRYSWVDRFDARVRRRLSFLPYELAHEGPSRFFVLVYFGLLLACAIEATMDGPHGPLVWLLMAVLLPADLLLPSAKSPLALRLAYLAVEGALMLSLGWMQSFAVVSYLLFALVGESALVLPVGLSLGLSLLISTARLLAANRDGQMLSTADLAWAAGAIFVWFAVYALRLALSQQREITELARELEVARRALQAQAETLAQQVQEDPLTGTFNRRYLEYDLAREFDRSQRFQHPLALAMVDIDGFKMVNDAHSHEIGDRALVRLAGLLRSSCRSVDSVVRLGGDEFVLYFPEASLQMAIGICERIRELVAGTDWSEFGLSGPLTVSIGLAEASAAESPRDLLAQADRKLYEAKQAGKNRLAV